MNEEYEQTGDEIREMRVGDEKRRGRKEGEIEGGERRGNKGVNGGGEGGADVS